MLNPGSVATIADRCNYIRSRIGTESGDRQHFRHQMMSLLLDTARLPFRRIPGCYDHYGWPFGPYLSLEHRETDHPRKVENRAR